MRQRTVSRSRARSQASIFNAEEDDLRVGLQRLLDKLRQHQPLFTEEDVTAISFPPEGSSSVGGSPHSSAPPSPRHSPSRVDNEDATMEDVVKGGGSLLPMTRGGRAPTASPAGTSSPPSPSSGVIDLDAPLSPPLFLTAVNIFDAKQLAKSRRVATDALRLVRQAYALIWRDPGYLATMMNGEPCAAPGSGRCRPAPPPPPSASRSKSSSCFQSLFATAAPAPTQRPDRRLALQLDECVRALLVYANASVYLCQSVSTNPRTLLLLAFIACAARQLEEAEGGSEQCGDGPGTVADIIVGDRNLRAEMGKLEGVWRSCGIEGRVADYLRECYLTEFLLDAALPPAVCSARYDGLQMAVYEKKQRITSDVVASRTGFAHMMRVAPLRGLCGLANMSAFGNPRLRARLLDRMATEGVVERLAAEMAGAMEDILVPAAAAGSPTHSPLKRPRQSPVRTGSPPHQRSRAGATSPVSRRGSAERAASADRERRAGAVARASTGLERLVDSEPTPVERIGQCVDILMLLTCPNLRPPDGTEESPSRSSTSSASAAVRSTTWASRDGALHEISLYLLAICFLSKTHARYAELSSLQLYAADCVLQWAAYSGAFYAMVVRAMDTLLDLVESIAAAPPPPSATRRSSLSPRRTSCSRNTSPQKTTAKETAEEDRQAEARGRRLLLQLLPGDEAGLLPLLTNLLQYTIHAQANAKSVRRWFRFLADGLLPDVFEAPQLTNGRRSSAAWGRAAQQQQQQEHQPQRSQQEARSPVRGRGSSPPPGVRAAVRSPGGADDAADVPVLARDLTRSEVVAAAPYFCFARRVAEETSWRDGVQPLFGKVVLLAVHVIVSQGHRCNLLFGQACACYDTVAPLLLRQSQQGGGGGGTKSCGSRSPRSSWRSSQSNSSSTVCRRSTLLMHQREEEEEEARAGRQARDRASSEEPGVARSVGRSDDEEEVFIGSTGRRGSPPVRRRQRGSPARRSDASEERRSRTPPEPSGVAGLSPFINSPSRSLVFYDAHSPSGTDGGDTSPHDSSSGRRQRSSPTRGRRRSSVGSGSSGGGGSSLRAALDDAVTATESPEAVTRSWSGRLSLRVILSSIGGHSEAPLLDLGGRAE
ncbi:hypothetical protein NESM_000801600 [Novymonas esmeraldas]|uniref:Uncharacterized protein n=1 Tax=Novymonas esmeraldas TaxID=1808958 RepID=A0AAW0EZU6_9TRYP